MAFIEFKTRVGSLRGADTPSKPVYFAANAIYWTGQIFPVVNELSFAGMPAKVIVDRYDHDTGVDQRIGESLRVPLLRKGPYVSADTKSRLTLVATVCSFASFIPSVAFLWYVSIPLGMYAGGSEVAT